MGLSPAVRGSIYATAAATGIAALSYANYVCGDTVERLAELHTIDVYIGQNLDPDAVKFSKVPDFLKEMAVYADTDNDGDFESYIFWDNRMGPDRVIMIVRSPEGGVDFPTLSPKAPRPDELPRGLSVDYHYVNGSDLMDCIAYAWDYKINPVHGDFKLVPIVIEKENGKYFWHELDEPGNSSGGKPYMKPRNSPKREQVPWMRMNHFLPHRKTLARR